MTLVGGIIMPLLLISYATNPRSDKARLTHKNIYGLTSRGSLPKPFTPSASGSYV